MPESNALLISFSCSRVRSDSALLSPVLLDCMQNEVKRILSTNLSHVIHDWWVGLGCSRKQEVTSFGKDSTMPRGLLLRLRHCWKRLLSPSWPSQPQKGMVVFVLDKSKHWFHIGCLDLRNVFGVCFAKHIWQSFPATKVTSIMSMQDRFPRMHTGLCCGHSQMAQWTCHGHFCNEDQLMPWHFLCKQMVIQHVHRVNKQSFNIYAKPLNYWKR